MHAEHILPAQTADSENISAMPYEDLPIMTQYLTEIRRYPILEKKQEMVYGQRIQAGNLTLQSLSTLHGEEKDRAQEDIRIGNEAFQTLVNHNLRLVVGIAKRFANTQHTLLDCISSGNIGLMLAARKFRPELGYKFSTYATAWIRREVRTLIRTNTRFGRLPDDIATELVQFHKTRRYLYAATGDHPTDEEIARALILTPAEFDENAAQELKKRTRRVTWLGNMWKQVHTLDDLSRFAYKENDDDTTLADIIADDHPSAQEQYEKIEFISVLHDIFNRRDTGGKRLFKPLELRIISDKFGLRDGAPRSLREIGKQYGMTGERVGSILAETIAKLQRPEITELLNPYLT